jgi:hypothetical protein
VLPFLSAIAPSAVAAAVTNAGVLNVLGGTIRIVTGAVIARVGAQIATPVVERIRKQMNRIFNS